MHVIVIVVTTVDGLNKYRIYYTLYTNKKNHRMTVVVRQFVHKKSLDARNRVVPLEQHLRRVREICTPRAAVERDRTRKKTIISTLVSVRLYYQ